ncbi:MAG: hypothetical protein ACLQBB_12895 [Solirubrobacteraceae bacterium]
MAARLFLLPGPSPQLLTRQLAEQADVVVTMGSGDACPYIAGRSRRYFDALQVNSLS